MPARPLRALGLVGGAAIGGQYVDVSVQDAVLSVGAFALQRLGDGSLEHRTMRRFRYGGVFKVRGGYIELLTLEDRQWSGAGGIAGPARMGGRRGAARSRWSAAARATKSIAHVREWMAQHHADEIVQRAQELGVPVAKYRTPAEVVHGEHERARGLFAPGRSWKAALKAEVLVAPFQFRCTPLPAAGRVPPLNEMALRSRLNELVAQSPLARRPHRGFHDSCGRALLHATACRSWVPSASRSKAAHGRMHSASRMRSMAECRQQPSTRCRPTSCRCD